MFIHFKVGDGKSIHLWWDWWHPHRNLHEKKYGYIIVYEAGNKANAMLKTVLKNKDMCWPPAKVRGEG